MMDSRWILDLQRPGNEEAFVIRSAVRVTEAAILTIVSRSPGLVSLKIELTPCDAAHFYKQRISISASCLFSVSMFSVFQLFVARANRMLERETSVTGPSGAWGRCPIRMQLPGTEGTIGLDPIF